MKFIATDNCDSASTVILVFSGKLITINGSRNV